MTVHVMVMMMRHMARIRWHFTKCMSFATFIHYRLSAREMILMINYMFINCCYMCWLYMWYNCMDVVSAYKFFWWTTIWWLKLSWTCYRWTTMWTFCMMMVMHMLHMLHMLHMMHTSIHGKTSCFDKLWFITNI